MAVEPTFDQKKLEERFDGEAHEWERIYREQSASRFLYNDKQYRRGYVLQALGVGTGLALDLGCGSGSYIEAMGELGYEVVGLDYSMEMARLSSKPIKNAEGRGVLRGDALKLPFRDQVFDRVVSVGVIEYFSEDDGFLDELLRVVKPGGRIVMTLRNDCCTERKRWLLYAKVAPKTFGVDYYYRNHLPDDFAALVKAKGFTDYRARSCHFYPLPWPLSRLLRPINNWLAHCMEQRFSKGDTTRSASTLIAIFHVPGAVSEGS